MSMSKSNTQSFIVKKVYESGVTTYLTKENSVLNFSDDRSKCLILSLEVAENMQELFLDDLESYPERFVIVIEKIETDETKIPNQIFSDVCFSKKNEEEKSSDDFEQLYSSEIQHIMIVSLINKCALAPVFAP